MNRLKVFLVALAATALLAGPLGVPAQAETPASASLSAKTKAKKKCQKLKGKKKKKCLKSASGKGGKGGKGKKPWAGSPYKPGITCAMSVEMQKKYEKHGLFCLDVGFGITTLTPL